MDRSKSASPPSPIRGMVDAALEDMSERFDAIYGEDGRRSIPPERLLRALLVQLLYSIRSERMLMEQLEYNLLFRWFVGLSANEPVWHPTVFTKNRDRLLDGAVSEEFFSLIVGRARAGKLLSDEHFTVDGTLIEAWAGQKSFQRRKNNDDVLNPPPRDPSNPTVNWHKQKRKNDTHQSLTDPFARLFKKTRGAEAKLAYMRVEEVFGWMKTVALQRKTRFRGPDRTGWMFTLAAAAYNLVRIRNLQAATA